MICKCALEEYFGYFCISRPYGMDIRLDPSPIATRSGFRALYNGCYEALTVFAVRMVRDREAAEDIVQSVFVALWERRDAFDSVGAARSYLYVSVRNRSIDFLQHRKVEGQYAKGVSASATLAENPDDDPDFFTAEVYARLFRAVDELPERQREVFLMSMKGSKNRHIAEAMGIAEETVRVQKRRAVQSLRRKLGGTEMALMLFLMG